MAGRPGNVSAASMDSRRPRKSLPQSDASIAVPRSRPPRIWKFWGTTLWGLFIFAAMFVGQVAVMAWFVLRQGRAVRHRRRDPRRRRRPDHLALGDHGIAGRAGGDVDRDPSVAHAVCRLSRAALDLMAQFLRSASPRWSCWSAAGTCCRARSGARSTPGFMVDVLKSARADGALWLLVIAFCVAAPISEEIFRARLSLSRLVGIVARRRRRDLAVVAGLDLAASAIRLVLLRRGVFDRPAARLSALSHQFDLADDRPARPQQSGRDASEHSGWRGSG